MMEQTMTYVVRVDGDLYREKIVRLGPHGVTDRDEKYGNRVFRLAQEGEKPSATITEADSFETLPLVQVGEVVPDHVVGRERRTDLSSAGGAGFAPVGFPGYEGLVRTTSVEIERARKALEAARSGKKPKAEEKKEAAPEVKKARAPRKAAKVTPKAEKQPDRLPDEKSGVRVKTSFGQSGPPLELPTEKLNPKEVAVVRVLEKAKTTMKIADIGARAFPKEEPVKQNSWTRNSLRRLVRGGLVEKVDRGAYQLAQAVKGRKKATA